MIGLGWEMGDVRGAPETAGAPLVRDREHPGDEKGRPNGRPPYISHSRSWSYGVFPACLASLSAAIFRTFASVTA